MKIVKQGLTLILIALAPAVIWGFLAPTQPTWNPDKLKEGEIRLAEVLNLNEDIVWLDARTREKYLEGHIPGALLLNEDNWDQLFMQFLQGGDWTPGKRVIVYCSSSGCQASHAVAEKLRTSAQIPNVWVLKDGWEGWQASKQAN